MSIQVSALSSRYLGSYCSVSRKRLNPKLWSSTSLRNLGCAKDRPVITISFLPSSVATDSTPIYPHKNEDGEEQLLQLSESGNLWDQINDTLKFSGPAVGLWICGPLMGLIDTAVVGQGSSIELAALGPGTVLCDYTGYLFMFLSIATSNVVAISFARQDKNEAQHQISILLFLGLACGILMLLFTKCYGRLALNAFTGPQNTDIIDAANTYVQLTSLTMLMVHSLGMKDSLGPVKALAVAAAINGIGDVVLCRYLGFGISGAAWATTVSQIVAAYMSIESLNRKGYNGFAFCVPSPNDFIQIVNLAAPAFIATMSKTAFYAMLVFFATSMGAKTVAAHQVMIQLYCICAVWGEPLSQTAQSFMPELLYGPKRNLEKSLILIGTLSGLVLGSVGISLPWIFPRIFSPDRQVTNEAGRDLKFLGISMDGIACLGTLLLKVLSGNGYGLPGCWLALVAFQLSLFVVLLRRLTLPTGILYSGTLYQLE